MRELKFKTRLGQISFQLNEDNIPHSADDLPAVEASCSSKHSKSIRQEWRNNNILHRDNLPAIIETGHFMLEKEDGKMIKVESNYFAWYQNGKFVKYSNNLKESNES